MSYEAFKFVHLLGVVLLLGNVTVTAVWKVFADRTHDPVVVAFAQRLVTLTDWSFTLGGVALTVAGGYGMAWLRHGGAPMPPWLLLGQALFVLSGLIWLLVLVPIQRSQARQARAFGSAIPPAYRRLNRTWLTWGVVATLPLVAALYLMIAKP